MADEPSFISVELAPDEVDVLQDAVAYWLVEYLVKGWIKPQDWGLMVDVGNKIGMNL